MRRALAAGVAALLAAGLIFFLSRGAGSVPPLGDLLDPADGFYRTARAAEHAAREEVRLDGLEASVEILRDERGVPHIFARSDRDAVRAMGYAVAQDRLFQLDFIPRVAAGRLSEVMGPGTLEADRFLRQTGMELGARRNWERIVREDGIERQLVQWYADGVNAYVEGLDEADLPFEFRLLGYRPEPFTPLHVMRLLEYMTYDLTYSSDDAAYAQLRARLDEEAFRELYPRNSTLYVPIVPSEGEGGTAEGPSSAAREEGFFAGAREALLEQYAFQRQAAGSLAEGFRFGKGSNNWAVSGARSATGKPILAGDMHLQLSLPALWYEVHLVTPTMNTYGVTFPGAPLPVEAFNDRLGWTFTNTGSDQIDHYALKLDPAGRRYEYEGSWRDLQLVPDTIRIKGAEAVIDTLYLSHFGPVRMGEGGAVAQRWMGHEPSRVLQALWGMNHARSYAEFEQAIRLWDSPMQNILYAGSDGTIAIRSTGNFPVRKGGDGAGLLDGTTSAGEWTGRIPFEQLPHAVNPAQGFLASTNQQPTDAAYSFYLGHDWRASYRSLRIDTLLRAKPTHSVEDLRRYQADVHAVQRDIFVPLLDTLRGLSPRAEELRAALSGWSGDTGTGRSEPTILFHFLMNLESFAWDEGPFEGLQKPTDAALLGLLRGRWDSPWLDVQSTPAREGAAGLLGFVLERTADTLAAKYGWGAENWRWGDHHKVVFRHMTRAEALRPLWRGPMEYPGFEGTLSPAGALQTTHSASWRVVVDFSQTPAAGYGVYPGGQSGNPFSRHYDEHIATYVGFEHYPLFKPAGMQDVPEERVSSRLRLAPAS